MKKVVKEIIDVQHDYLSEKQQHPNPLKLEDIAKKIDELSEALDIIEEKLEKSCFL